MASERPRLPVLPVLLALTACSPEPGPVFGGGGESADPQIIQGWYQDYFTPTWELCGEPTDFQPYSHFIVTGDIEQPVQLASDECADALLADLRVDWDEVADYEEYQIDTFWGTWVSVYALLAWPMGTVDELRSYDNDEDNAYVLSMLRFYDQSKEPPFLREPFIAELERLSRQTGETRVNALVYNMVMSSILRTSFVEPAGAASYGVASVNFNTRTLSFWSYSLMGNLFGTTTLVHEMGHLWANTRHVTCPALEWPDSAEGLLACDESWDGAFGYQMGVAWIMALHHDWDLDDLDDDWLSYQLNLALEHYAYLVLES